MNADTTTAESAQPRRAPRLPPRWIIRTIWLLHRTVLRITGGRFGLRTATADRAGYLQLATIGRKTGKERRAIVAYIEDGRNLVTLAMNGWGENAPAWWLNLEAQPDATVDMPNESRAVRARIADEEERSRLWAQLDGGPWGDIEGYATRRSRETPIVILEPRDSVTV
jgi:deazaflavin-dependent oxidoreductase (nitroreductase family)